MSESFFGEDVLLGTDELQLPDALREPVREHLEKLREHYLAMNWARRVGFGKRPAVVVIDLARWWTQVDTQMGTRLDSVVESTCRILESARRREVPIFFSTYNFDAGELPDLHPKKMILDVKPEDASLFDLDPRLARRANEKILRKNYSSCFMGTNLKEMLAALGVDTLIVTGVSTSHCVYSTSRDACDVFRVVIPREAVGDRCQIMHWVNLLDLDIDVGDVLPVGEVVDYLDQLP